MYVQDWLSNNKLKQCSLGAHGLMVNIMCLMHKEDTYGKILLNQKFKRTDKPEKNFALMLAKLLPFDVLDIEVILEELICENVLIINDTCLTCKRMVKDAETSAARASNGKKGGEKTQEKISTFALANTKAKKQANTENESEYINEYNPPNTLTAEMSKIFKTLNPNIQIEPNVHYPPCLQIAYRIAKMKGWQQKDVLNGKMQETLESWKTIAEFAKNDEWLQTRSLQDLSSNKEWDRMVMKMSVTKVDKNKPVETKIKLK